MALLLALLCTTISLACLILGCMGTPTNYTTRHGIRVYGKRVIEKRIVELSTHAAINEARSVDPRYTASRIRELRHCSIEFVEKPFACGYQPTGLCSGVFFPSDCRMRIALVGNECDDTALIHEQIHALNYLVENSRAERIQPHTSPKWFYGPTSVMGKANRTLGEFCKDESIGKSYRDDSD